MKSALLKFHRRTGKLAVNVDPKSSLMSSHDRRLDRRDQRRDIMRGICKYEKVRLSFVIPKRSFLTKPLLWIYLSQTKY